MPNSYRQLAGKAHFKKTKINFGSNTPLHMRKENVNTGTIAVEFGNFNTPPPLHFGNINASGAGYFKRFTTIYPGADEEFVMNTFAGFKNVPEASRSCLLDINLYIGRDQSEEDHLPWLGVGNSLELQIKFKHGLYWEEVVYTFKYTSPPPQDYTVSQIIGPYNLNMSKVLYVDKNDTSSGTDDYFFFAKITGDESKQTGDVYVLEEGSYITLEALPPVIPDSEGG